jgi:ABC-type multidrug transport system fused ATPase/permease subunit
MFGDVCNRVMVLSSGQIAEFDNPKTLIGQKESLFCNMARDAGIVKQD